MSARNRPDAYAPGDLLRLGSRVIRVVEEGPVNHPIYCWDEEDKGEWVDRLALRVESVPARLDPPAGGEWIDESCFDGLEHVEACNG